MEPIQEAKGVLADAEKSLRDLMQRELHAQRYSDLPVIAQLADGLSRLAAQASSASQVPNASSSVSPRVRTAPSRANPSSPKATRYPRFERDEDKLVKVGWSKKRREEYEHRAPKSAALAFTEHLGHQAQPGKAFAVEDVVPAHDRNGDELPGYQVYLVLGWLRDRGTVEKRGRDGYVVTQQLDGSAFDVLWEETAERGEQ